MTNKDFQHEAELLSRIAEGDERAFELLALRYTEKLFAHTLTFIKSYPKAQEIVQDIFLKVWNNREKLTEVRNFDDYLFILSRNHLISAIRKKEMITEHLPEEAVENQLFQSEEHYELKELRAMLEKGIDQLPEQKKRIFLMIYDEGYTQQEVADMLGMPRRTVRWNFASAINWLRTHLNSNTNNRILVFLLLLPSIKSL